MQGRKKEKKRRTCVRKVFFSSYVWRGAHGRVCVGIKHERNLCRKCLWQSLWTFGSISCFSQIHRWIYVKIESVLVWKVQEALPKIQLDRAFCTRATRVGSRGGCSGVHGMISMAKPLDFWFNQLFLSNPPLDLCQNQISLSLEGVEGPPQILA